MSSQGTTVAVGGHGAAVTNPIRIKRIVTHHWPHLDEIAAIIVLQREGYIKYPGVGQAEVVFTTDGCTLDGRGWETHLKEGTLHVGTGGGPLDEHPTKDGKERAKGESACSLVIKDLGLSEHPIYKRLSQMVTEADISSVNQLHLANLLKTKYRLTKDSSAGIRFASECLNDWLLGQTFFIKAREWVGRLLRDNKREAVRHVFITGEEVLVLAIQADNFMMGPASRTLGVAVLIQRHPTSGLTQILSDQKLGYLLNMRAVLGEIRKAEIVACGGEASDIEPNELYVDGNIHAVPNWFYQNPGNNILNGSETTPNQTPTALSLQKILDIVAANIGKLPS